jgi:hypothetical protein
MRYSLARVCIGRPPAKSDAACLVAIVQSSCCVCSSLAFPPRPREVGRRAHYLELTVRVARFALVPLVAPVPGGAPGSLRRVTKASCRCSRSGSRSGRGCPGSRGMPTARLRQPSRPARILRQRSPKTLFNSRGHRHMVMAPAPHTATLPFRVGRDGAAAGDEARTTVADPPKDHRAVYVITK